jgi:hypothetical protein
MTGSPGRAVLYRRYKRLLGAVNALRENEVIDQELYAKLRIEVLELYEQWRVEIRAERAKTARPRGRPKLELKPRELAPCRNDLCTNKEAYCGAGYCSRECAPFASMRK